MSIVKLNNKAVSNATAFGSISSLGSMKFIKKLTASSSGTLSFVDGTDGVVLDDTYKEYVFTFNNMHPATDGATFGFLGSSDNGSSYGINKTTTQFRAYHYENGSDSNLNYRTSEDLAQSTSLQGLTFDIGNANDESASGYLQIFNPSSSVFVKHYISKFNCLAYDERNNNHYSAGYFNTTSAVNAIRFQMSSGNIDAGDICLYGIA